MTNKEKAKKTNQQAQFEQKMVAYFDEKLLNVVMQLRGVCIAAGIEPEKFWAAFVNDKAQDEFFIMLHAAQNKFNLEQQAIINKEKEQKNG